MYVSSEGSEETAESLAGLSKPQLVANAINIIISSAGSIFIHYILKRKSFATLTKMIFPSF